MTTRTRRHLTIGCALLCAALGASAATLEDSFRSPDTKDRPWAYWWWINGHVDRETITGDMEAMRRVGFGGLLMFDARGYWDDTGHVVLPKPQMEFMSAEWRELLAFGIREAARVGLEVSVNLSSCAGALKGPWEVGPDAPKRLVCLTAPLAPDTRLRAALKPPQDRKHFWDIATCAVRYSGPAIAGDAGWINAGDGVYTMRATSGKRVDQGRAHDHRAAAQVIDLTAKIDAGGSLEWDVPDGQWALVRFGYTTIDGHEYDVDVLDPTAVEGHFTRMGKAIIADAGPLAGKTLTHFYSVSWEGAVPTWTGAFEREFERYRGYAIRPWLPVLAGFTVQDETASEEFLRDYRRARNDCFRDHFYGKMMALSHAHGIRWHAESGGPWVRKPEIFGEADQLAFLARTDMPQGEFWYTGKEDRTGRQLSRAQAMTAHVYGKRIAAAEAFTHMREHWSPYPAVLKRAGDESFIDGVNHLIWHTFTCSPRKFGTPGTEYFAGTHINRKVTWFEQAAPFLDYLARCQLLLRQGLFVADVCAYTGDSPYQHWGRHTSAWSDKATLKLPPGHGYDLLSTEALLDRATAKGDSIALPDGMSYRILAVDLDEEHVPLAALRKIAQLKRAGVTVAFGTRIPNRTPGRAQGDEEVRALARDLWKDSPTLEQALARKGLKPDFEGPFESTHRRDGDIDLYFVAGTGKGECTFRVSGARPELWDPVRGTVDTGVPTTPTGDGRTRLTLDLPRDGSVFVLFRKGETPPATTRPDPREGGTPMSTRTLAGPWQVEFQPGRGAPDRATFDALVDWTKHPDTGIRHFSGTATYRHSFDLAAGEAKAKARLQLGEVCALARVILNGKDLGIVWTAPWHLDLTGTLKQGNNDLQIEVTNPWKNRLIGDAALPPEQRVTKSNLQYERGKRTLKLFQGYSSEDALQPSGLVGPVTLELF